MSSVPERTDDDDARELGALVADHLGIGLWLVEGDDCTRFQNAAMRELIGELDGIGELAACLPGVPITRFVAKVRTGGGTVEEPSVLLKRSDRPGRLVELRIEPGPLPGTLLIAMRDVTDRARVQRLGAVIETAMALGHEIANPLAILRGEIELLVARQAEEGPRLASMLKAVDRIDDVLRRLRKLAEPRSTAYLPSRGVRMVDLVTLEAERPPEAGEGAR